MTTIQKSVFRKLVAMFRPHDGEFLNFPAGETINGPNDRAMVGFDTHFPKAWLVEDHGFTEEEADWLIWAVNRSDVALASPSRPTTF